MILMIFYLACLLFSSCLPHGSGTLPPICPKNFSCANVGRFEYPFYDTNDTRCGLVKVKCSKNGGEVQPGDGQSYEILSKYSKYPVIHNKTFQKLVENRSCEALTNNFNSPEPLLFSFIIQPFITLFKCTNDPKYAAQMEGYFDDYSKYGRCKYHNLYYKYLVSSEDIPAGLPQRCEVIKLPIRLVDERISLKDTNIFSLLSSNFSLGIYASSICYECHKKEGYCQIRYGKVQCLNAKEEKTNRKLILITVLTGFAVILALSFAILMIRRRYRGNQLLHFSSENKPPVVEDDGAYFGVPVFSYNELDNATQHFNPSQQLGDGGFGAVYYGKLRDGREVAVKRLYEHNYKRVQHFMNEIKILTRLRHQNLVVLYGCTSHQSRELLLVYEYIPNGTLADHLHGVNAKPSLLTWAIRMNIAIETAKALVFLHASEIIHRDVKTSNILLDHNFCVKVADFGISRLVPNDVTHVSTAPQGTPGYVDPEYHQCYQLTDKSDVYSFGVVLIELISSLPAVDMCRYRDEINLANLAINKILRCEFDQLIDPFLGSNSDAEIERMTTSVAALAFRCLQYHSEMRPTMNEVLDVLKEIQAQGRTEAKGAKPRSPEAQDVVVLLKSPQSSPISVTEKWHSSSS